MHMGSFHNGPRTIIVFGVLSLAHNVLTVSPLSPIQNSFRINSSTLLTVCVLQEAYMHSRSNNRTSRTIHVLYTYNTLCLMPSDRVHAWIYLSLSLSLARAFSLYFCSLSLSLSVRVRVVRMCAIIIVENPILFILKRIVNKSNVCSACAACCLFFFCPLLAHTHTHIAENVRCIEYSISFHLSFSSIINALVREFLSAPLERFRRIYIYIMRRCRRSRMMVMFDVRKWHNGIIKLFAY